MHSPLEAHALRAGESLEVYDAARHGAEHRRVIAEIFNCEPADADRWLGIAGEENIRVLESDGAYRGTALMMAMGQSFGGRCVRMRGVAGVAVPVPHRRDGTGARLMAACLREMRAAGDPISTLYASTGRLYRAVGYEWSGAHTELRLRPEVLPSVRSALRIRALDDTDRAAMQAVSDANARHAPGHLFRCGYIWPRVLAPGGKQAPLYGVEDDQGLRGFVAFQLSRPDDLNGFQRMRVLMLEAADHDALLALLALLRGHQSMVREIELTLAPDHPLLAVLPEQRHELVFGEQWMTRIVHLPEALAQRGWPAGLRGALVLRVHDPILPDNEGRWLLEVDDGEATVTLLDAEATQPANPETTDAPAGPPEITLDVGALAPLYTGHQPAEALAQRGRAQGTPEALAAASALFVGRAPTCPEMF